MRSLLLLSAAALALTACGDDEPDRSPDQNISVGEPDGNTVRAVDCEAEPDRYPCRVEAKKPAIEPPAAD